MVSVKKSHLDGVSRGKLDSRGRVEGQWLRQPTHAPVVGHISALELALRKIDPVMILFQSEQYLTSISTASWRLRHNVDCTKPCTRRPATIMGAFHVDQ